MVDCLSSLVEFMASFADNGSFFDMLTGITRIYKIINSSCAFKSEISVLCNLMLVLIFAHCHCDTFCLTHLLLSTPGTVDGPQILADYFNTKCLHDKYRSTMV